VESDVPARWLERECLQTRRDVAFHLEKAVGTTTAAVTITITSKSTRVTRL
jgi:hypothetical protein